MEEYEIRKNFASNISQLRKNAKLNQTKFAELLSYSDKAISKWENGDTIPDIFIMSKIADYFNISIDDLISNKNVIKKSNAKKNHFLITSLAVGLCSLICVIVYLFLEIFNVEKSYISFIGMMCANSIILIIFTSIWFTKKQVLISISSLIWSCALLIMVVTNFIKATIIIAIAIIINLLFLLFMSISK